MRGSGWLLMLVAVVGLGGCHSAFVDATVSNRSSKPISLVEVDYPSASFGTQTLAPGQDFHYRFKVLGSGDVSFTFTDASNAEQKSKGPFLREGDEGKLEVAVGSAGVVWSQQLAHNK